mgnify:CR=1 FL=1
MVGRLVEKEDVRITKKCLCEKDFHFFRTFQISHVFSGQNSVTLAGEARAIKYAADNGAVILQCSWGYNSSESSIINGYTPGPATEKEWAETYPLEKEALDYFINNAGSPNGVIDGWYSSLRSR